MRFGPGQETEPGGLSPLFWLHAEPIASIESLPMKPFVCEKCGADLRLSLPDRAYLCESSPKEHRFDRGETEQAWLKDAAAVVEAKPGDVDAVFLLASLCGRLASTSLRAGDPDPARVYMGQLVGVTELLYQDNRDDERVRGMFMEALIEQATVAEKLNDPATAVTAYERLLPLVESQAEAEPKNVDKQRNLSSCLNGAGRMMRALGNYASAKVFFDKDLAVLDHLHELYPEKPELGVDRAVAHFNLFLVMDNRSTEVDHLEAVVSILGGLPEQAVPDMAKDLEKRAQAELERLATADEMEPSQLARATADAARNKEHGDAEPTEGDSRAWLIEQVSQVLMARRKRLNVVR